MKQKPISLIRAKFIRAIRRLNKINRFAERLNEIFDVSCLDIAQLTALNITKRKLNREGKNLFDLPDTQINEIVNEIREESMIPEYDILQIKQFSEQENESGKQLTQ